MDTKNLDRVDFYYWQRYHHKDCHHYFFHFSFILSFNNQLIYLDFDFHVQN